jgi:hypothetical protein
MFKNASDVPGGPNGTFQYVLFHNVYFQLGSSRAVGWAERSEPTKTFRHNRLLILPAGTARRAPFAHPHMGPFESSIQTGVWILFFSQGAAAVRGAMRSVACRRDRRAQGLASGDLCSCSLHHLISGRTAMARYPHSACLRRGSYKDETHLRNSLFVGPRVARSSSIPR